MDGSPLPSSKIENNKIIKQKPFSSYNLAF